VRPDLPELKEWPYFWQQGEYVMGGGIADYMFLALAVDAEYRRPSAPRK
jgi:endoglucanase